MDAPATDKVFAGSVPSIYETCLVPLIFEPYAVDIANRVAARRATRVLEIAAGTGVLTRALAKALPPDVSIVATDLNSPMLEMARTIGTARAVAWRQADAMQLPFSDAQFEVVACQFGVMFFPDKARAFAEVRRVLQPGGVFIFNVWDRIEDNEFAFTVTSALQALYPNDPPQFLARTPHGYHDRSTIAADLGRGGFAAVAGMETVTARSRAASARVAAVAYCQGTRLRSEIEARGPTRLDEATALAEAAIARRFGSGPVDAKMQAHIVMIEAG
jgi:SAM-dependent methyltransferase